MVYDLLFNALKMINIILKKEKIVNTLNDITKFIITYQVENIFALISKPFIRLLSFACTQKQMYINHHKLINY